MYLQHINNICY